MLKLSAENNAVILPVKVVPGASTTRYLGILDGRAKIAVAAPPEKGKANEALIGFLARLLGLKKRDFTVISGLTSARKTVRVARAEVETVRDALRRAQT